MQKNILNLHKTTSNSGLPPSNEMLALSDTNVPVGTFVEEKQAGRAGGEAGKAGVLRKSSKTHSHIEIVRSSRGNLSSLSTRSCNAIYKVLQDNYETVGISTVNTKEDLDNLVNLKPDLVFLGMKYVPDDDSLTGEKIWLQEYLQSNGIATTGSESDAHRLELDKAQAKQCAVDAGLITSPFYVSRHNKSLHSTESVLSFPMFVKPTSMGGGSGIDSFSVVHNNSQLNSKIASISLNLSADSLIEQFLPGREFSVAVLYDSLDGVLYTMPLEIVAPQNIDGDRVLSAEIKSADTETTFAVEDGKLRDSISILALSVFRALGARDYGRIDIRLDENGVPNFLEANLIPSLIDKYGNFPKACVMNKGLGYEDMILKITELALNRKPVLIKLAYT